MRKKFPEVQTPGVFRQMIRADLMLSPGKQKLTNGEEQDQEEELGADDNNGATTDYDLNSADPSDAKRAKVILIDLHQVLN